MGLQSELGGFTAMWWQRLCVLLAVGVVCRGLQPGHCLPWSSLSLEPAPGEAAYRPSAGEPRSWASHRHAAWGEALSGCREVPEGMKFYLYDLESAKLCLQGEELLNRAKQLPPERLQHYGAELFLEQQLRSHPWRTEDPSQASLFVLPPIFGLPFASTYIPGDPAKGLCHVPVDELLGNVTEEMQASFWYRRKGGHDHLLVGTDFHVQYLLINEAEVSKPAKKLQEAITNLVGPDRMERIHTFREAMRPLMTATKCRDGLRSHGKFVHWARNRTSHQITIPHMAAGVLVHCEFVWLSGDILCDSGYTGEHSFEEYRKARNYTMFFIGNTARHEASFKKWKIRPKVVDYLGDLYPPNILASTSAPPRDPKIRPACSFDGQGPTTGCMVTGLSGSTINGLMHQSLFSIHVRGDDASSSRVYEALASGTPQLFLAERFYDDIAPFRCRIPYKDMFVQLDQKAFQKSPKETMADVLDSLMRSSTEWEQLWYTQKSASRDLLWHLPDSRVGHNMIEDALRSLVTDDR